MHHNRTWRESKRVTPETAIKHGIKHYLGIYNWFCFPILQGLGAHKGIPDMIACKDGITLFIEVKTANGKQSEYQKHFQDCIEQSGCIYILARSSKDVEDAIAKEKNGNCC